jgi:hypothetical protein
VLGQKGTYRQAINAHTKPKVQNSRREPAAFDDAGGIEHASCRDDLCAGVLECVGELAHDEALIFDDEDGASR